MFSRISIFIGFLIFLNACGGGGSGNLLYNPAPIGAISVDGGPIYDFGNHLVDILLERIRRYVIKFYLF